MICRHKVTFDITGDIYISSCLFSSCTTSKKNMELYLKLSKEIDKYANMPIIRPLVSFFICLVYIVFLIGFIIVTQKTWKTIFLKADFT